MNIQLKQFPDSLKIHKPFLVVLLMTLIFISVPADNLSQEDNEDVKTKVEELLSQLTLDEKISMVHANSKFTIAGVERLGIPEWKMSDGPHGVREEISRDSWDPAGWDNDYSTYLPVGTALASTWNPELAYQFGVVLGREARAREKDVILGPGINVLRTPLCGRNFEYMGEDPFLISQMVVPYIKGVQEQDVAACVKHYALNNQEYERFKINVEADERALREIYLPGFKAAVQEGGVLSVMSAYNKFRGKWCSENKYLLTDILKEEWGFDGVVISDWDGTHSTVDAALAGLDIEMGTKRDDYDDYYFANPLKEAVDNGEVPVEVIDDKVRRILTSMIKSNVLSEKRYEGEYISARNFVTARKVAEEAVVLLKNDSVLPLNKDSFSSIAVIGENATMKHAYGGGSSAIKTKYEITPLEGLENLLGDDVEINHAQGYKSTTTFDWEGGVVDTSEAEANYKKDLRAEAVEAAKKSDVVLMFVGLNHHFDLESVDRPDMKLPYEQDQLIAEVLKVNKNVVVVLVSGSPVDMTMWIDQVPAIVQGWYAGSEAGNVFADVLFGNVNPSGKIPFTFPKKLEDSPAHKLGEYPGEDLVVNYNEGIFVGYRYFDSYDVEPQFAFGHGLSYTTFDFSDLSINKETLMRSSNLEVKLNIKNTGDRSGAEVVQLYIEDVEASVDRPKKELKAYQKVFLESGEEKEVTFTVNTEMLSFYDTDKSEFTAETGNFIIHIGSASDDIKLSKEFNYVDAE